MHISHTFNFTPRAEKALEGRQAFSFKTEFVPELVVGDLFSTEEIMPHVLVIKRRHFHFVTPDHLQVEYLLDLQV